MSQRYSRQIRFAPLGAAGQDRIQQSSALLVGVGALGTHIASTLVRAGVGRLWLVDRDVVEVDNLPRQVLFDEADAAAGAPKAIAAATHLARINSHCRLDPVVEDFDHQVYERLGARPDVILDGTDNFATRYVLNDLAIREDIPWVYGGAVGSRGTAASIVPGITPCLRCLIPEAAPGGEVGNCETDGVLAPTVAAVAAFQSTEAIKILAGRREALARGVWSLDAWSNRCGYHLSDAERDPSCASCGTRTFPALENAHRPPVRLCGRNAAQVTPQRRSTMGLEKLAERLATIATDVTLTPHMLRFRVEECAFSVFRGGRALLFGVDDPERARILYDRYVGAV